jgi:hypothetical protein
MAGRAFFAPTLFLLKITLVPLVVWLASAAGRRWGHGVTGWVSGLPLIAGPISVFLALDQGAAFAAEAAATTLAMTIAAALHCFVFAHASRRLPWWGALLAGWAAFVAAAWPLAAVRVPPVVAFGATVLALALMIAKLPAADRAAAGPAPVPRAELAVRVLAAAALAALVTLGAESFGARLSGVFLGFPITGSVLPAFAAALHGPAATTRLLAGFISGLLAFAAFHVVVATALPALGIAAAYLAACAAALATTAAVARVRARSG